MPYITGKIYFVIIIAGLVLVTAACGSSGSEDITPLTSEAQAVPDITDEPQPTPTLMNEISEPVSPISPLSPVKQSEMTSIQSAEPIKGGEAALTAAIADLSKQTGVPTDDIKLVSMEAIEWSDTSLGCPQEDMMYAQVITPGYLIVLEAEGQSYEYHTDEQGSSIVLCKQ